MKSQGQCHETDWVLCGQEA